MTLMTEVQLRNRLDNSGLQADERARFMDVVMTMPSFDAERLLQLFETSPPSLVGDFWETVSDKYAAFQSPSANFDGLAEKNVTRLAATLPDYAE
jgi:hypothetical protein